MIEINKNLVRKSDGVTIGHISIAWDNTALFEGLILELGNAAIESNGKYHDGYRYYKPGPETTYKLTIDTRHIEIIGQESEKEG